MCAWSVEEHSPSQINNSFFSPEAKTSWKIKNIKKCLRYHSFCVTQSPRRFCLASAWSGVAKRYLTTKRSVCHLSSAEWWQLPTLFIILNASYMRQRVFCRRQLYSGFWRLMTGNLEQTARPKTRWSGKCVLTQIRGLDQIPSMYVGRGNITLNVSYQTSIWIFLRI